MDEHRRKNRSRWAVWAPYVGAGLLVIMTGCATGRGLPGKPRMAIILDDAGEKRAFYDDIFRLPCPVTLAIIPASERAREILGLARKHKLEFIGHIPMQSPVTRDYAAVVATNMSFGEIWSNLTSTVDSLPGITGINNHMGSIATVDRPAMEAVMATLASRNMFAVDSRTTRDSLMAEIAHEWHVPCLAKDDFLDSEAGETRIGKHLNYLLSVARRRGYAVGIGHVQNRDTIMALNEFMHKHARDVEFVGIGQLIRLQPL